MGKNKFIDFVFKIKEIIGLLVFELLDMLHGERVKIDLTHPFVFEDFFDGNSFFGVNFKHGGKEGLEIFREVGLGRELKLSC